MAQALGRCAVAAVLALALVNCGGGGTSATPVATNQVNLPPSYRFDPVAITVSTGTTVTWTNNDNFTHSVQFTSGGLPTDPLLMPPGQTATFTFTTPGTFNYQCHLHPQNMKGTVTVNP